MSTSALRNGAALLSGSPQSSIASSRVALRALLLAGIVASVAVAAWVAEPATLLQSDAELARLLRGMALIKAVIALAAIGVLLWRLGQPLPRRMATAYLVGAWLIAGATVLIWQLSFIPLAALTFHAGEFTLLIAAWRDRQGAVRRTPVHG